MAIKSIDRALLGRYLSECILRDIERLRNAKLSHREWLAEQLKVSNAMLFIGGG